jgi:hypothetical protein
MSRTPRSGTRSWSNITVEYWPRPCEPDTIVAMDRQHAANLWEQIDAATTPVVVLSGPAGSGKTEAILTPFRRHSDASNRRKRLLIVPNRLTADHLKDRLLADSERGVILTPRIVTFDDLAQRILTSTAHLPPTAQLSAMRRRLMLRSIVADLDQAGTLTRLRRLRNAPGLLPAIEASLAELKRAAIAPEDLTGVIDPDLLDQDILAIYERFQATLQAEGLTDVEGRMWLARDVLSNAATHACPCPVWWKRISSSPMDSPNSPRPSYRFFSYFRSGSLGRSLLSPTQRMGGSGCGNGRNARSDDLKRRSTP